MRLRSFLVLAMTDFMVWVLLAILMVAGYIVEPRFITIDNLLNIISHTTPLAIMVFGLALLLMIGRIDLSMESTYALGPIVANLLVMTWFPSLPDFFALPVCILIGICVGYFNGYLSVKLGVSDFLVGLAMLLFVRGVVKYLIPEGLYGIPDSFCYLGSERLLDGRFPVTIIVLAVVFTAFYLITRKRPFGRRLLATGSNREAAFISGINTNRVQMTAFVVAGAMASFAGMISAGRQLSCTNGMGEDYIMTVLASVVLGGVVMTGGRGTIIGALGGALVLQTLENVLTLSDVNPFLQDAVFGFILLSAIVFHGVRTRQASRY
ncbi:MAG: ABC transporter permease [Planctomycetota bacterium]|jgi:simple sugar transport system permease protein/ribose transport system permease protein|nr:ABC transporter permease [Planctomycetota bacterium]